MVAHIDFEEDLKPDSIMKGLNYYLLRDKQPAVVLAVQRVDNSFHARHSALERRYLYRVLDRGVQSCLTRGRVWSYPSGTPLDIDKMNEAAQYLVGEHDFTTFRYISLVLSF